MTRKEALTELLERVESGTAPIIYGRADPCELGQASKHLRPAFNGSLDAAKALHEAVLPGWDYNLAKGFSHVFPPHDNGEQEAHTGLSDTPARAWLQAIIKALIAECDE